MEKVVILKRASQDTVEVELLAEWLRTLFPGCEVQVCVASFGEGPLTRAESLMWR